MFKLGKNVGICHWDRGLITAPETPEKNHWLEGEKSDTCPVMSGVPQGSVLGPCLFLLYVNDMPDMIESNIRLFADDTIMYLTVSNHADCQTPQSDLSKLETWESEWLMALNPDKCEVIRITNKEKNNSVQLHLPWGWPKRN